MISHACPYCEHHLHSSDALIGTSIECPQCRVMVEVPATNIAPAPVLSGTPALASAPAETVEGDDAPSVLSDLWQSFRGLVGPHGASGSEPRHLGICRFCEERAAVRSCYLRIRLRSGREGQHRTSLNRSFLCHCCDQCYGRGRRLTWLRYFSLVPMFAWIIGFSIAGLVLPNVFFGPDGVLPQGALGLSARQANTALAISLFAIAFLGFFVSWPVWMYLVPFRGMKRLLPPGLNEELRDAVGVANWNIMTMPVVVGHLRAGERASSLGEGHQPIVHHSVEAHEIV